MLRLLFVITGVLVIAITSVLHYYGYAMVTGIVFGGAFFLSGVSRGGLIGKPHAFGHSRQDVSARIGIALAAAGIAAGAQEHNPPYPKPFLIFYMMVIALGCLIAFSLAIKAWRETGKNDKSE